MASIYSPHHDEYREKVRDFFRTEVEPMIPAWEKAGIFDRDIFYKAGKAGILCPNVPKEYGGGGGDLLHLIILFEEHGYSPGGVGMEVGLTTDACSLMLMSAATEKQKQYWLPRLASGDVICEGGFCEPQSGSDMLNMHTTAERRGDDYVINGQKVWVGNGDHLDMIFVAAMTDRDAGPKGISVFLVDATAAGVTRQRRPIMTKNAGNFADFTFEDVVVPKDRLLGEVEGKGLMHAMGGVNGVRLAGAARIIAASELAYRSTVDFVKQREAFGKKVFDFQNTQFILADIKTELAVTRAFLENSLVKAMSGDIGPVDTAMCKLWASELEGRIMDRCLPLFGAYGYSGDNVISKLRASAYGHLFGLGTSAMQRITIARSI